MGGKGPDNDLIVPNRYQVVSRQHCVFELDNARGAVYIVDCSTNGTWLNGIRLPAQKTGKVVVSHGDELMFTDPSSGKQQECGYMINLQNPVFRERTKLEAPRRLMSSWHDGAGIMMPDLGN